MVQRKSDIDDRDSLISLVIDLNIWAILVHREIGQYSAVPVQFEKVIFREGVGR